MEKTSNHISALLLLIAAVINVALGFASSAWNFLAAALFLIAAFVYFRHLSKSQNE